MMSLDGTEWEISVGLHGDFSWDFLDNSMGIDGQLMEKCGKITGINGTSVLFRNPLWTRGPTLKTCDTSCIYLESCTYNFYKIYIYIYIYVNIESYIIYICKL